MLTTTTTIPTDNHSKLGSDTPHPPPLHYLNYTFTQLHVQRRRAFRTLGNETRENTFHHYAYHILEFAHQGRQQQQGGRCERRGAAHHQSGDAIITSARASLGSWAGWCARRERWAGPSERFGAQVLRACRSRSIGRPPCR